MEPSELGLVFTFVYITRQVDPQLSPVNCNEIFTVNLSEMC
jgi:hypothetical protein